MVNAKNSLKHYMKITKKHFEQNINLTSELSLFNSSTSITAISHTISIKSQFFTMMQGILKNTLGTYHFAI